MIAKTANIQLKTGLFLLGFMIFLGIIFLFFGNFAIHIDLDTRWQQPSSRPVRTGRR